MIAPDMEAHAQTLIAHYQKALIIKPDSAIAYQYLGDLFQNLQNHEQATHYYFQLMHHCINNFEIFYSENHGLYYPKKARFFYKAILFFKSIEFQDYQHHRNTLFSLIESLRSFLIYPETAHFFYLLIGSLYAELQDFESAKQCYQKSLFSKIKQLYPELASQPSNQPHQPNFLIPGFWKSGTSSCYQYLIQHPQVLPAINKEIDVFSPSAITNLDYYLAHFPAFNGQAYLTGEASCTYAINPTIPKRFKDCFPDLKIIILLRHPIDRAISQWYMAHQFEYSCLGRSLQNINSIEQAADLMPCLEISCYIRYLPAWFDCFAPEQILIVKSEDLFGNPEQIMNEIYGFLGLPAHSLAQYTKVNMNQYPPITASLRQQLTEFFQPYNKQLEDYLGRKFNW